MDALSRRKSHQVMLRVEGPGFASFRDLFVTVPYFPKILLDVKVAK